MKKVVVDAKVPANEEKGIKEVSATVSVNFAETIEEAVKEYGAEAILSNALANWKVTLQANIRSALKRGDKPEAIAARLASAKMGVAQAGSKIDPKQAFLAEFNISTPERQAEMIKDLQKRAAAAVKA